MELDLRSFTPARVAIGRTGNSVPTAELLRFQLDHARARDAVYQELAPGWPPLPHIALASAARNRAEYLRRPDLGRKLSEESKTRLAKGAYDAAIVIADGLSALAVQRHALPLLEELLPLLNSEAWSLAPLTVVSRGRVAIGDEIGQCLGARSATVLIGERPGLTSPDSLGIYVTWDPRPGRTDAERNCISNVRGEGLSYGVAARLIHLLLSEARRQELSGVGLRPALKEEPSGKPAITAP
jgi:ethanolamine ammonia-lyase small subunit